MSIAKIIILAVGGVVVLVVVPAAVAAFSVFNGVTGEAEPLTSVVISEGLPVEEKIASALTETSAFYLEITNDELSALLLYRAGSVVLNPATRPAPHSGPSPRGGVRVSVSSREQVPLCCAATKGLNDIGSYVFLRFPECVGGNSY